MAQRSSTTYGGLTWYYSAAPDTWLDAAAGATLTGQSGADNAIYGGGHSTLVGGGGGGDNDFYLNGSDIAVAGSGDGVDTAISYWGDLTLGRGIANGTLQGAGTLTGNTGNNILTATGTDPHTLVAGTGSDLLVGAGGAADRFVITKGGGSDAIQNFAHGVDTIQLDNYANFAGGFASVQAALTQQGSNTVLNLGGGQTLTIAGTTASQFTAADFALPFSTAGLKLTFGDEFSSFNASDSGIGYAWNTDNSGQNTGELQYYGNQDGAVDPFSVSNGVLDITASAGANPAGKPYVSGEITTKQSFSQLYGYFEIRAELPAGQGLFPAFWLLPADGSWPPELDVVEAIGSDTTHVTGSTHTAIGGPNVVNTTAVRTADYSAGYHTYGVDWEPSTITFYIDGNAVSSTPTPADMDKPMYLLADLAVGGSWAGAPNAATVFPASLKIDYIHAYATAATRSVTNLLDKPIVLSGWGQTVALGNGTYSVSGGSGKAAVTLGNGDQSVQLGGDYNNVRLGDGDQAVSLAGASGVVVAGTGTSSIHGGTNSAAITVGGTPQGTTALSASGYSDRFTSTAAGNVSVSGTLGYATVTLADGNDAIALGGGNNLVTLGAGASTVTVGASSNAIHTAGGGDTITVTGWKNILDAGPGANVLNGGSGYDTFLLNAAGQGTGTITGFTVNDGDVLNLARTVAGLGVASLANLGSVVTATAIGADTALSVTPPGGAASTFAVLKGVTTSVPELLAHNAIRIS